MLRHIISASKMLSLRKNRFAHLIARSVNRATNAADMARFVETLFIDMCKFVAEVGISDYLMVGGNFRGAWKSAPAQLFTRIFLDAISPGVFRQACTSRVPVNITFVDSSLSPSAYS